MSLNHQFPVLPKQHICWLVFHALNEHVKRVLLHALLSYVHFVDTVKEAEAEDTVGVDVVVALTD